SKVAPVQTADPSTAATIPDDCGRAAHTVTGADASGKRLKAEYNDVDGTKATIDRDFVIANISAPSGLRASDAEEEAAEADAVPATEQSED
ncbi:MAG: hypothetical protein NWQ37_09175, partial [Marivita lacus]|nr:hypothetical protein [Marivita lacus]